MCESENPVEYSRWVRALRYNVCCAQCQTKGTPDVMIYWHLRTDPDSDREAVWRELPACDKDVARVRTLYFPLCETCSDALMDGPHRTIYDQSSNDAEQDEQSVTENPFEFE